MSGDICPICCGTERENTVRCPLDCGYLREARGREKEPEIDPRQFPHPEIKVDEDVLRRNEPLLIFLANAIAASALETEGAIDNDVKEALDAHVRTYLALRSGLVYEVRPDNPIAARIQSAIRDRIRELEQRLAQHDANLRDSDILGVLVFLQRLEIQKNNGRQRGRAFIDFLREFFPPERPKEEAQSSLILP